MSMSCLRCWSCFVVAKVFRREPPLSRAIIATFPYLQSQVQTVDTFSHQLADLILGIEAEMRRISLWDDERPSDEALSSLAPFCHDTLTFPQWLQWVFLAKMKMVLETEEDFPSSSEITPLAEYSFERLAQDTDRLLELIREFDAFINRHGNEAGE